MINAQKFETPSSIVSNYMERTLPIDLKGLASTLKINVVNSYNMNKDVAGRISRDDAGNYTISINAFDSPRCQRFTLAHEIAHFVLHKNLLDKGVTEKGLFRSGIPQSGLPSSIKRQANIYAAEMLLPEDAVRNTWNAIYKDKKDYKNLVDKLADIFNVSKTAANKRLEELGLKHDFKENHD